MSTPGDNSSRRRDAGAGGIMTDHSKPMMRDGHFVLERNEESGPRISFLTGSMLNMNMTSNSLINKGIKVQGEQTFHYSNQKDRGIYIFEAGLPCSHAEVVKQDIYIYITCNKKKVLVGTLSSKHPRIQLNLLMNEDFLLTHTSKRRSILFNAYQFSPVRLSYCLSRYSTNKKYWVMKVEPMKENSIHPIADEKKYHILKVFADTSIKDTIDVHVQTDNKFEKIGTLSSTKTSFACNLKFEENFKLSHTSKRTSVFVSGYTVPDILLKELPGPPVLRKNEKESLMLPAKNVPIQSTRHIWKKEVKMRK